MAEASWGSIMLNRLTVSALLKTVILVPSFCAVVGFSLNAWDSWGRLQAASRIAVIADASANIFKAMHNLRTDRSTTNRLLNSDAPMDPDIEKYLRNIRDTEMPAMGSALGLLGSLEFAQQQTLVPEFDRVFKTMGTLQKEFWEAVAKPKAQRRPELAKEYMAAANAMLEVLEKLSGALSAAVNHQDATSCWRSSRSPGCCVTPPARPRLSSRPGLAPGRSQRRRGLPTRNIPA